MNTIPVEHQKCQQSQGLTGASGGEESTISNDFVSAKRFHVEDFTAWLNVHALVEGEDHHGMVFHVHGVDFITVDVSYHCLALFDHWDVNAVGHRANVGHFL